MNTHALLNVNMLIDLINKAHSTNDISDHLTEMLVAENRDNVLGDQEMIMGTASLLNEIAINENKMSDKMCRIFWNKTKIILESKGIL